MNSKTTKQILLALVIVASTLPICAANATACPVRDAVKTIMNKVKQTVNSAKSHLPKADSSTNDDAPSLDYPPSEFIITG